MLDKLDSKIAAVEAFVNDSDEHPEITLAMFRRMLDDVRLWQDENAHSFRPDFERLGGLWAELLVLGRGLAALCERCLAVFDEDSWRDHLRDLAEADRDQRIINAVLNDTYLPDRLPRYGDDGCPECVAHATAPRPPRACPWPIDENPDLIGGSW